MSGAEDQACSDTLAALRRWLALRLARLEANPPALGGILCAEADLNLDPNLQTALALTHVYEEALRVARLQRTHTHRSVSRPHMQPAAAPYRGLQAKRVASPLPLTELPEPANELEDTLRRVSPECDARSHCNDYADAQEPAYN